MESKKLENDDSVAGCAWGSRLKFFVGFVIFIGCFLIEQQPSLLLAAQPQQRQSQGAVALVEVPDPGTNDTNCLQSLHTSLHGIALPSRSHYCRHDEGMFFEPIPGCLLPPPQPYWFAATLTTGKGIGIYLMLFTRIKNEYSWFEKKKTILLVCATTSITVVSAILLLIKACNFNVPTRWQHYQCAGITLSDAPWASNFLLLLTSSQMQARVVYNENVSKEAQDLFYSKSVGLNVAFFSTFLSMVILLGPFIVTNLLWASLCGAGIPLCVGVSMATSGERDQNLYEGFGGPMSAKALEKRMNWLPLRAIPGSIIFGLTVQWMAAASAYVETGQYGILEAMAVASTERRTDVYTENMYSAVLAHRVWLTELVNEVWP